MSKHNLKFKHFRIWIIDNNQEVRYKKKLDDNEKEEKFQNIENYVKHFFELSSKISKEKLQKVKLFQKFL